MNQALFEQLLERLAAPDALEDDSANLVVAACQGPKALEQALLGQDYKSASAQSAGPPSQGVTLRSITVTGFRGIGPTTKLELKPGPGLTLVVGRNGSGKSSFAEGLEVLLTGESSRWLNKARVWRDGWQNLHHTSVTEVQAEFLLDGQSEPVRLKRSWVGSEGGQLTGDIERLGWAQALETYRPFLPYSEISSLLNQKPSEFHDALSAILGLGELVETEKHLKDARLQREKEAKLCAADAKTLLSRLSGLGDPRAIACRDALSGRTYQLDVLERNLTDQELPGLEDLKHLRQLANLPAPDIGDLPDRIDRLVGRLASTDVSFAETSLATADLLDQALQWHRHHPAEQDCPVCGSQSTLAGEWVTRTTAEVERLRKAAGLARELRQEQSQLRSEIQARCLPAPPILSAAVAGVDLALASAAWDAWSRVPEDLASAARHMRATREPLAQALWAVTNLAGAELEKRNSDWQPVALELTAWLVRARRVESDKESIRRLAQGEKWLKRVSGELRNERLRPVAESALDYYAQLRQDSNVLLRSVSLEGVATQRRVALDVQVDDVEGAALSVMSQGELNALALSLFLPRATLPESPFRFIVIDDPVQAMDPAKVDGLARVLEKAARTHQVLVFTHDARLEESVRRQGIAATLISVTRRARSVVELRETGDPVSRALDDARALARTDQLDRRIAARVVPRFCRDALEAALSDRVSRQLFSSGRTHEQVVSLVESSDTLNKLAALALAGHSTAVREAHEHIRRLGGSAWTTYQAINQGAHGGYTGDLGLLVEGTQELVGKVRA